MNTLLPWSKNVWITTSYSGTIPSRIVSPSARKTLDLGSTLPQVNVRLRTPPVSLISIRMRILRTHWLYLTLWAQVDRSCSPRPPLPLLPTHQRLRERVAPPANTGVSSWLRAWRLLRPMHPCQQLQYLLRKSNKRNSLRRLPILSRRKLRLSAIMPSKQHWIPVQK